MSNVSPKETRTRFDTNSLQKARLALLYEFIKASIGMKTLIEAYYNSWARSPSALPLEVRIHSFFFDHLAPDYGEEDHVQDFFDDLLIWGDTDAPFNNSSRNIDFWADIDVKWKMVLYKFNLYMKITSSEYDGHIPRDVEPQEAG